MWFFWSPINLLNIVFCVIVLIVSLLAYRKSKDKFILVTAVAFTLFGLSHVCAMSMQMVHCTKFIAAVRAHAYSLIIYALLRKIIKK